MKPRVSIETRNIRYEDNLLTAVREARERISAAVDHDAEKLVERCRKIEEQ